MQRVLWEKRGGNPTWHRERGVQDLLPGTQPTLAESQGVTWRKQGRGEGGRTLQAEGTA